MLFQRTFLYSKHDLRLTHPHLNKIVYELFMMLAFKHDFFDNGLSNITTPWFDLAIENIEDRVKQKQI